MTATWPILYLTPDGEPPEAVAALGATGRAAVEEMAVGFLSRWVGLSLGTEEIILRPTAPSVKRYDRWYTVWGSGFACALCGPDCACDKTVSLVIPGPVVDGSLSVTIDGVDLDPSAYRVDNRNILVRQDGLGWPRYHNVATVAGDHRSWSISYTMGTEVPTAGQIAAGVLAEEFAKAFKNDGSCQLPRRIQTITRQGVTIDTVYDNFQALQSGMTGIWVVDQWVTSMTISLSRPKVYSPDTRKTRRTGAVR